MRRLPRRLLGDHEDHGPVMLWLSSLFLRFFPGQLTCGEFEAFLYDYHEGALTPKQRRVFERHLDMCAMCRVSFRSYLRVIELGKRVCDREDAAAPGDLPDELVHAILAARAAR